MHTNTAWMNTESTKEMIPDRRASAALPSPTSCPTRIDAAIPTAKGKLKKMKEAIVNVIMCASNSVVPNNPAKIVVISKDHASADMESAPEMDSFQNGRSDFVVMLAVENTGQVDCSVDLLCKKYPISKKHSAKRVIVVAHGAPAIPISKA
mmetsp:Transcript_8658/g.11464  ORF Transcript_8658/g.11464 Transcript_8658/m.11464 type:complete len:151 (+) Transcript_8658:157-609(+)